MTDAAPPIERLKTRPEFLACAKAPSCAKGAVLVQARPRDDRPLVRVGFTATKRIGNAVARNRAKRRMRAAAHERLPLLARTGHDYVLVARTGILTRDFQALLGDLDAAMTAAHAKLDAKTGGVS